MSPDIEVKRCRVEVRANVIDPRRFLISAMANLLGQGGEGNVEVQANAVQARRFLSAMAKLPGQGGDASTFRVYHLYVVYTSRDGSRHFYRGGPEYRHEPGQGGLYIRTMTGLYIPGTVDYDEAAITGTIATGVAAEGLDACLRETLRQIERQRIAYHPLGPNSNTVVRKLLERCGLLMAQPVALAPGFDHPSLA